MLNSATREWEVSSLTAQIFVRCATGRASDPLDVWVNWDTEIEDTQVTFAFDEEDIENEEWIVGDSGESQFTPHPYLHLSRMLRTQSFSIGTEDITIVAVFEMTGLENALASLSGWTCGVP